jgi:hypothetical protein
MPVAKAEGGMIQGVGTGTSDSIPALLSHGEFVVKQAAVDHYGQGFLDLLNSKALRFASGGYVGASNVSPWANAATRLASGGFADDIADYAKRIGPAWADHNKEFNDSNPSAFKKALHSLNPLTGLGSAVGDMHTAAGKGDHMGMAMAGASAIPAFGAFKALQKAVSPTVVSEILAKLKTDKSSTLAGDTSNKNLLAEGGFPKFGMGGEFLKMVGLKKESPEVLAYREQERKEKEAAKTANRSEVKATSSGIKLGLDGAGGKSLDGQMKDAGLAEGGFPKFDKGGEVSAKQAYARLMTEWYKNGSKSGEEPEPPESLKVEHDSWLTHKRHQDRKNKLSEIPKEVFSPAKDSQSASSASELAEITKASRIVVPKLDAPLKTDKAKAIDPDASKFGPAGDVKYKDNSGKEQVITAAQRAENRKYIKTYTPEEFKAHEAEQAKHTGADGWSRVSDKEKSTDSPEKINAIMERAEARDQFRRIVESMHDPKSKLYKDPRGSLGIVNDTATKVELKKGVLPSANYLNFAEGGENPKKGKSKVERVLNSLGVGEGHKDYSKFLKNSSSAIDPNKATPALVSHGEFRVSPDAVNHYGSSLMHSVNDMSFPKFAEGGIIGSGTDALDNADMGEIFNHIIKLQPSDATKPPIPLKARNAGDVKSMLAALRSETAVNLS